MLHRSNLPLQKTKSQKKLGQMDENTAENCHLYAPSLKNSFQSQNVIHSMQSMNKKFLSLKKSSHGNSRQNAALTNSASGNKKT